MSATRARWPMPALGLTALAAAIAVAAACFSDDTATTAPPEAVCEVPLEIIEAGHTIISIRDFAFFPDTIEVARGTTVTWVNCEPPGIDAHTTTSDVGVWASGLLSQGAVFTRTFDEAGTFPYHCVPHPFMRGEIVVP